MPVKKYILTMKSDLSDLEKLRSFMEEIREGLSVQKSANLKPTLPWKRPFQIFYPTALTSIPIIL